MGRLTRMRLGFAKIAYGIIVVYLSFARAVPIADRSGQDPKLDDYHTSNRSSGFQVLADGTQDLAALVGLFATDGVERYTIDYTRGFLPPVTAPLSLLGLLGYVRALLKLSFGVDFCERTGFSIISLRSYAGVRSRDVARDEQITHVHYLERQDRIFCSMEDSQICSTYPGEYAFDSWRWNPGGSRPTGSQIVI